MAEEKMPKTKCQLWSLGTSTLGHSRTPTRVPYKEKKGQKIQFCIEHIFVFTQFRKSLFGCWTEQKWDMSVCEWQTNLLLASDVYNSLKKKTLKTTRGSNVLLNGWLDNSTTLRSRKSWPVEFQRGLVNLIYSQKIGL